MRGNKRVDEDDVVGMEVDLDHGYVTFRKLPANRRRKHVFGAFCEECGEERCREWNNMDPECAYGYMGRVPKVMCYKHRLVLGNLPVGHIDGRGEWCHPNGRLIADIVIEFMKLLSRDQVSFTAVLGLFYCCARSLLLLTLLSSCPLTCDVTSRSPR